MQLLVEFRWSILCRVKEHIMEVPKVKKPKVELPPKEPRVHIRLRCFRHSLLLRFSSTLNKIKSAILRLQFESMRKKQIKRKELRENHTCPRLAQTLSLFELRTLHRPLLSKELPQQS